MKTIAMEFIQNSRKVLIRSLIEKKHMTLLKEYFDETQSEFHLFIIKRNSVKNSLLLIEAEFFFDKF